MHNSKIIFQQYDEYGPVQVIEDNNSLRLAFGNGDHQSCMLKAAPLQLQFDYLRAMALATLFSANHGATVQATANILLLGLGAGSLPSFLHAHCSELDITVVELRQLVIAAAYDYFGLPKSERITIVEDDAGDFLNYDNDFYSIIMSDIFTEDGIDDTQLSPEYITGCHARLKKDGWLVLNCWYQHRGNAELINTLRSLFTRLYSCYTQSGNWIIFASNQINEIDKKELKKQAKQLSESAGFSFLAMAQKLQNL